MHSQSRSHPHGVATTPFHTKGHQATHQHLCDTCVAHHFNIGILSQEAVAGHGLGTKKNNLALGHQSLRALLTKVCLKVPSALG